MGISRTLDHWRALVAGGLLIASLAVPAAASADTTGGTPSIGPAFSRDATISIDSVSIVGRVIANVRLSVVCQPFDVFDWGTEQYVQTFDGSVEGGTVTVIQAQGRTIDNGTADFGGLVTCDGATVNHLEVPVVAAVSPWRTGSAVAGASISIADRVSFEDSDSAGTGGVAVRLSTR